MTQRSESPHDRACATEMGRLDRLQTVTSITRARSNVSDPGELGGWDAASSGGWGVSAAGAGVGSEAGAAELSTGGVD